jgi:hypothetical protein
MDQINRLIKLRFTSSKSPGIEFKHLKIQVKKPKPKPKKKQPASPHHHKTRRDIYFAKLSAPRKSNNKPASQENNNSKPLKVPDMERLNQLAKPRTPKLPEGDARSSRSLRNSKTREMDPVVFLRLTKPRIVRVEEPIIVNTSIRKSSNRKRIDKKKDHKSHTSSSNNKLNNHSANSKATTTRTNTNDNINNNFDNEFSSSVSIGNFVTSSKEEDILLEFQTTLVDEIDLALVHRDTDVVYLRDSDGVPRNDTAELEFEDVGVEVELSGGNVVFIQDGVHGHGHGHEDDDDGAQQDGIESELENHASDDYDVNIADTDAIDGLVSTAVDVESHGPGSSYGGYDMEFEDESDDEGVSKSKKENASLAFTKEPLLPDLVFE